MTLYRHASSRSQLLAMAWEHLLDAYAWPGFDLPWRDLLYQHATALWDLLAEHPGRVVSEMSGIVPPPRMVALYDDLAVALVEQGFSAEAALLAVDTVIDMTIDHRRGVEALAQPTEGTEATLNDQIQSQWSEQGQEIDARGAVRQAMRAAIATNPRLWFQHKLNLVLDGIESGYVHSTTPKS